MLNADGYNFESAASRAAANRHFSLSNYGIVDYILREERNESSDINFYSSNFRSGIYFYGLGPEIMS